MGSMAIVPASTAEKIYAPLEQVYKSSSTNGRAEIGQAASLVSRHASLYDEVLAWPWRRHVPDQLCCCSIIQREREREREGAVKRSERGGSLTATMAQVIAPDRCPAMEIMVISCRRQRGEKSLPMRIVKICSTAMLPKKISRRAPTRPPDSYWYYLGTYTQVWPGGSGAGGTFRDGYCM